MDKVATQHSSKSEDMLSTYLSEFRVDAQQGSVKFSQKIIDDLGFWVYN
jgi:hypothetical protein